eukprot:TRINITY_DN2211_c0_g2_i1.p1 TRINITY_DN2211_c0_g2~~TRINITY_DN2211_c0_g2_i1.p1  ORF type:complete len:298 (-),score=74.87 TRINITY_DN2211_c0_g2_i1:49-942(-)
MLLIVYWAINPNDWVSGSMDVMVCADFYDWACYVVVAWVAIILCIACVLFVRVFALPAAKPLKKEVLCIVVWFVLIFTVTQYIPDAYSPFYQVCLSLVLYWFVLYQPLKAERKMMSREKAMNLLRASADSNQSLRDSSLVQTMSLPIMNDNGGSFVVHMEPAKVAGSLKKFEDCLRDEAFCDAFKTYLSQQFSLENLLFWEAVQNFKSVYNIDPPAAKKTAISIIENFVQIGSALEINISSDMRTRLLAEDCQDADFPSQNMFHAAQTEVLSLMYTGFFVRFKQTPEFQKLHKSLSV